MYRKRVPKITLGRYAGTPIDQLPNSYLRWMIGQDFPKEWLEVARKKLSESPYSDEYLSISRHAYDQFSLRFLDLWKSEGQQMGLGTFIAKRATEAWTAGQDVSKRRHADDGTVKLWRGIRWVFNVSPVFPDYKDLITVYPDNTDEQQ